MDVKVIPITDAYRKGWEAIFGEETPVINDILLSSTEPECTVSAETR